MKRDKSKERKGDSSELKSEEKNTTALVISDDDCSSMVIKSV